MKGVSVRALGGGVFTSLKVFVCLYMSVSTCVSAYVFECTYVCVCHPVRVSLCLRF